MQTIIPLGRPRRDAADHRALLHAVRPLDPGQGHRARHRGRAGAHREDRSAARPPRGRSARRARNDRAAATQGRRARAAEPAHAGAGGRGRAAGDRLAGRLPARARVRPAARRRALQPARHERAQQTAVRAGGLAAQAASITAAGAAAHGRAPRVLPVAVGRRWSGASRGSAAVAPTPSGRTDARAARPRRRALPPGAGAPRRSRCGAGPIGAAAQRCANRAAAAPQRHRSSRAAPRASAADADGRAARRRTPTRRRGRRRRRQRRRSAEPRRGHCRRARRRRSSAAADAGRQPAPSSPRPAAIGQHLRVAHLPDGADRAPSRPAAAPLADGRRPFDAYARPVGRARRPRRHRHQRARPFADRHAARDRRAAGRCHARLRAVWRQPRPLDAGGAARRARDAACRCRSSRSTSPPTIPGRNTLLPAERRSRTSSSLDWALSASPATSAS